MSLGLDWDRTNELLLSFSLVMGLPMYFLDVWLNKRIATCLLGLFLFRGGVRYFNGGTPALYSPVAGQLITYFTVRVVPVVQVTGLVDCAATILKSTGIPNSGDAILN